MFIVAVVDYLRSVQCEFDNEILCGYVTSELGSWRWERTASKDTNPNTGPDVDAYDSAIG